MFVQYLNEEQQSVLLHYAYEMMRADSSADAREMHRLDVLRAQAQPGVSAKDVAIADLPDLFEDRMSCVVLLFELIGMGYADERFDQQESELINAMAKALAIGEDEVLNIVSWVKRQLLLVKEAHQLMEG